MSSSFQVSLEDSRCGPPRVVAAWGSPVPSPAVVRFAGVAQGRDVILTLRFNDDAVTEVSAVEVVGTSGHEVVTAEALRQFRLAQLVRAAVIYLRIPRHPDESPVATVSLVSAEDVIRAREGTEPWEPVEYYPTLVVRAGALVTEPGWLSNLKSNGPRARASVRTIGALFDLAIENGEPPNASIQRILDMNSATASRWVAAARSAGTVAPSTRSRRGPNRGTR